MSSHQGLVSETNQCSELNDITSDKINQILSSPTICPGQAGSHSTNESLESKADVDSKQKILAASISANQYSTIMSENEFLSSDRQFDVLIQNTPVNNQISSSTKKFPQL